MNIRNTMSTIVELHTAIAKGWTAEVKRIAMQLKNCGVDISSEIEYARKLSKIKGGTWNSVYQAVM